MSLKFLRPERSLFILMSTDNHLQNSSNVIFAYIFETMVLS